MEKDKFSFGAASVMREVPPGETAVIKFNGKAEKVETDCVLLWVTHLM